MKIVENSDTWLILLAIWFGVIFLNSKINKIENQLTKIEGQLTPRYWEDSRSGYTEYKSPTESADSKK